MYKTGVSEIFFILHGTRIFAFDGIYLHTILRGNIQHIKLAEQTEENLETATSR